MDAPAQDITVRRATTPADLQAVYRLRYEIYVVEMDIFGHDADHEQRLLTDATDEGSIVLGAWVGDEVIGTARITSGAERPFPNWMRREYELERFEDILPDDRIVILSRFMVRRDFRGTLAPMEIMATELRTVADLDADVAFTDCEPFLLAMYTMLGFRPYCGTVNDPNRDLNVPLIGLVRDHEHLRALNSPLLGWGLERLDPDGGVVPAAKILERCDTRPPVERVDPDIPAHLATLEGGVLSGLDAQEIAGILQRSHTIRLEPGVVLIRAGQTSRMVYVVLEGSVVAEGPDRVAGPGDVVGEVTFFTGNRRTLDVVAGPDGASVLTISERTLRKLIDSHSRPAAVLLLNLARTLAGRLAD